MHAHLVPHGQMLYLYLVLETYQDEFSQKMYNSIADGMALL